VLALLIALLAVPQAPEAEVRVVEYLKANVKPGQPVVVSELYNTVFTGPEERSLFNRLFNTFFKMPLYVAQYQKAAGKPPTLAEISEQFRFQAPGEADVMLRIMESDPRMPAVHRARPGERGDHERGRGEDPRPPAVRQGAGADDHGLGGQPAPAFTTTTYDGQPFSSDSLAGTRIFSTSGSRAARPAYGPRRCSPSSTGSTREGLRIVALNADRISSCPRPTRTARPTRRRTAGRSLSPTRRRPLRRPTGRSASSPRLRRGRQGDDREAARHFREKAVLEEAIRAALSRPSSGPPAGLRRAFPDVRPDEIAGPESALLALSGQLQPEERVGERVHVGRLLVIGGAPWPPSMFSK